MIKWLIKQIAYHIYHENYHDIRMDIKDKTSKDIIEIFENIFSNIEITTISNGITVSRSWDRERVFNKFKEIIDEVTTEKALISFNKYINSEEFLDKVIKRIKDKQI